MSRAEALTLYRCGLRVVALMPASAQRKAAYNIRSIFELRRNEADAATIRQLLDDGWADLDTLKGLLSISPEITEGLFGDPRRRTWE
eukprot:gene21009-31992_t